MKKFKFSLEAVLKWKQSQEEEALKVMGDAMRRRQEVFEMLQTARRHLGALLNAIREARAGRIDAWSHVAYTREVGRQEAICKHCEEMLQKASLEEEKSRAAYLLRRREAEALKKLKSKRQVSHEHAVNRSVELELEEIMLSREGNPLCNN